MPFRVNSQSEPVSASVGDLLFRAYRFDNLPLIYLIASITSPVRHIQVANGVAKMEGDSPQLQPLSIAESTFHAKGVGPFQEPATTIFCSTDLIYFRKLDEYQTKRSPHEELPRCF
jgi:hypothetical protein